MMMEEDDLFVESAAAAASSLLLNRSPPEAAESWRSVPKVVRTGMKTLYEQVEAQRVALVEMGQEMTRLRSQLAASNSSLETKLHDLVVEQASVVAKGVWSRVDKALREQSEGVNRRLAEALEASRKSSLARSEEDGRMRNLRIERELTTVRERLRSLESGLEDARVATEEVDGRCVTAHARLDAAAQSIDLLGDELAARAVALEQQDSRRAEEEESFLRADAVRKIAEETTRTKCVEPLQRQLDETRRSVFEEMAAFAARGETMIEAARKSSEALVEAAEEAQRAASLRMSEAIEERRREVSDRLDALAASVVADREATVQVCRAALDAYDAEHRGIVLEILDEREAANSKRKKESMLRELMVSDENLEEEWSGGGEKDLMRALVSTCRRAKRACDTEIPSLRKELARVDEAAKRRVGELSSASTAAIAAIVEDAKKYRGEAKTACEEATRRADEAVQAADDVVRAGRDDILRRAEKMVQSLCEEARRRNDKAVSAACDRHKRSIDDSVRATCVGALARLDESTRSSCEESRRRVDESVRATCKDAMVRLEDVVRVACDDATRRADENARAACEDALQGAEKAARDGCESALKRADDVARAVCHQRADAWEATHFSRQQATLALARNEVVADLQRLTADFDARLKHAVETARSDAEAKREEKCAELAADLTRLVDTALEGNAEERQGDKAELAATLSRQFGDFKSELRVEIERARDGDRNSFVSHVDLASFGQTLLEKARTECEKRVDSGLADVVRTRDLQAERSKFDAALADVVRKPELEAERARDQADMAVLLAEARDISARSRVDRAEDSDDSRVLSLMISRLRHDMEVEFEESRHSLRRHVEARISPLGERFDFFSETNRTEHSELVRHTQKLDRDLATLISENAQRKEGRGGCEVCFETREKAVAARERDIERLLVYYDSIRRSHPAQYQQQQQQHTLSTSISTPTSMTRPSSREGGVREREEEEKEELAREQEVTIALQERIRSGQLLSHVTSTLQSIAAS